MPGSSMKLTLMLLALLLLPLSAAADLITYRIDRWMGDVRVLISQRASRAPNSRPSGWNASVWMCPGTN